MSNKYKQDILVEGFPGTERNIDTVYITLGIEKPSKMPLYKKKVIINKEDDSMYLNSAFLPVDGIIESVKQGIKTVYHKNRFYIDINYIRQYYVIKKDLESINAIIDVKAKVTETYNNYKKWEQENTRYIILEKDK